MEIYDLFRLEAIRSDEVPLPIEEALLIFEKLKLDFPFVSAGIPNVVDEIHFSGFIIDIMKLDLDFVFLFIFRDS